MNLQQYVIKRNKILNFSSIVKQKKVNTNGKVQEVKLQRDLFERLFGISLSREENLDIKKILSFPLTPVPLSFYHLDGTINKSDKSAMVKIIENCVEKHGEPSSPDVLIIDGIFYLNQLKQLPQKFGQLSLKILQGITKTTAHKIIIIFDTHTQPSIKKSDFFMKDDFLRDFIIKGPKQNRPSDFNVEL
ncbi:hypothetical protein TKK_0016156 [Trichogramma kaykai]